MKVLGIMSGTSLDGIDFALCEITSENEKYKYELLQAETYTYDNYWINKLKTAQNLTALEFIRLHKEYGKYIGKKANVFINKKLKPDIIASHGHTIFHEPSNALTFQIGDGAFIAAQTQTTCVSDFRTLDTALGGQGAPLVPIGDKFLFSEYKYCLNLGGFSNISYDNNKKTRIAYDISPVNFALNYFAEKQGLIYDEGGKMGREGEINYNLLEKLNNISYYSQEPPKSLAREFFEQIFLPIINTFNIPIYDVFRTIYEHIAVQIEKSVDNIFANKILITGGGANNKFLIEILKSKINNEIIIPQKSIIDYKEAIIFALLGYLRINNIKNTFSSVTGSKCDNYGGVVNLM